MPPNDTDDDADDVGSEVLGRVRGRFRPRALAVTALVQRHDVAMLSERGGDGIEPVGVGCAAVEEQNTRSAGRAPFENV
jgi:hypothetical protein